MDDVMLHASAISSGQYDFLPTAGEEDTDQNFNFKSTETKKEVNQAVVESLKRLQMHRTKGKVVAANSNLKLHACHP